MKNLIKFISLLYCSNLFAGALPLEISCFQLFNNGDFIKAQEFKKKNDSCISKTEVKKDDIKIEGSYSIVGNDDRTNIPFEILKQQSYQYDDKKNQMIQSPSGTLILEIEKLSPNVQLNSNNPLKSSSVFVVKNENSTFKIMDQTSCEKTKVWNSTHLSCTTIDVDICTDVMNLNCPGITKKGLTFNEMSREKVVCAFKKAYGISPKSKATIKSRLTAKNRYKEIYDHYNALGTIFTFDQDNWKGINKLYRYDNESDIVKTQSLELASDILRRCEQYFPTHIQGPFSADSISQQK